MFERTVLAMEPILFTEPMVDDAALRIALTSLRTQAGVTQREMARRLETSQAYIARVENGHRVPTVKTICRWSGAVGKRVKIEFVK